MTHAERTAVSKLGVTVSGVDEEDVERCVAEQSWSRVTYGCVMKARTTLAIGVCTLES